MLAKISTIKQELDRRFSLTTRQVKWLGTKYIGVSFPHVYDYLDFINKSPLLQEFVCSEAKHYQDFLAKLPDKGHEEKQIQLSTFRHFNLSQGYNFLQEQVFLPIKQLSQETDRKKLDPWPLALTKTPFKRDLQDLHNRLMNLLAEYEVTPESQIKEPTEAVKQLGLSPDSKWEDLEIAFRSQYEIRIKYKTKEYIANHEEMGFAD